MDTKFTTFPPLDREIEHFFYFIVQKGKGTNSTPPSQGISCRNGAGGDGLPSLCGGSLGLNSPISGPGEG